MFLFKGLSTSKAFLFFGFTLLIVAVLMLSAVPVMSYSGGKANCKKTNVPIKIDGDLNDPSWLAVQADFANQTIIANPQDWYQIKPKSKANTNDGGLRVTRGRVDNDADLKGVWMTVWDSDYIYFGFAVSDDVVVEYQGTYDVKSVSDTDSVVVIFDTKHDAPVINFPAKQFDTGVCADQSLNMPDDVYYYTTVITSRGTPVVWSVGVVNAEPVISDPANKHVAAKKTATGYIFEMRIPWSIFTPFYGAKLVPTSGMVMGFDVSLVDSDPTYAAPVGGAMAWSSDFENDNSPAVLGELTIVALEAPVASQGKLASTWGDIKR
ncbi:MAG: sugar-binding protein [Candidatus Poribacteria bacterium]